MKILIAVTAVALTGILGCGDDGLDEWNEVGEAQAHLTWMRDAIAISPGVIPGVPPEAIPSHTVSVAVSDGRFQGGPDADVVVAYERNGESWRSWGTLTSANYPTQIAWNKAGGGMLAPTSGPTDNFAFGKYEGWSSVIAFQSTQGVLNDLRRHFLYVTKFGSTVNGSTVTSGSGGRFSTDVAVLKSIDGGLSFASGRRLTSPPIAGSGVQRWKIEFPVAGNVAQPAVEFYAPWMVVAWRQTPILTNGSEGTPSWKARFIHADFGPGSGTFDGFFPALTNDPFTLPMVDSHQRGPISVSGHVDAGVFKVFVASPSANTMRLLNDGVTWNPADRCPNPTATSVPITWRHFTARCPGAAGVSTCDLPTEEVITSDDQFRICVGASRDAVSGPVWNKQLSQPRMIVDPVNKDVYVAVTHNGSNSETNASRLRLFRKVAAGAFAQIFITPLHPDGRKHDEWAPVLGVYHYPGETADIFLSRRSTWFDTTSSDRNKNIHRLASRSGNAGTSWDSPSGWNIDHLTSPWPVQMWLGAYDGAVGTPYQTEGWQAAWADPRNPPHAHVYAATVVP